MAFFLRGQIQQDVFQTLILEDGLEQIISLYNMVASAGETDRDSACIQSAQMLDAYNLSLNILNLRLYNISFYNIS
jgi:hypothetical protein